MPAEARGYTTEKTREWSQATWPRGALIKQRSFKQIVQTLTDQARENLCLSQSSDSLMGTSGH